MRLRSSRMAFSIPCSRKAAARRGAWLVSNWLSRAAGSGGIESGTFVSSPLPVPSCSRDCAAQQHYELQIRLGNVGYRTDAGLCRLYPSSLTGFCHQHSQRLLTGCRRAVGEGPC